MYVKPVFDKLLIKPDEKREMSKGGIIVPESAESALIKGTVIDVGNLVEEKNFVVGDRVIYSKYAPVTEIEIDDVKHVIMEEKSILAKFWIFDQ